ncbi:MAG: exodeoxyribonuclease VII large subunit [bacterium]|nr:exodeoxyribonuclease VII large subunit [bacterium]
MPPRATVLSVGELTRRIRQRLESDPFLAQVWVRGEVSNCRLHSSGHLYLTLKDAEASLRCVMFRSRAAVLAFRPGDGLAVIARGRVGVYDRDGSYQLYVEEMVPEGVGSLFLAFEQLKTRLEAEGLFDPSRKRPLPLLPRAVGVVTSPTGAAIRDIITVSKRRYPGVRLVVAPVLVQGDAAPGDIARGIGLLGRLPEIDVIIVGRGGGSFEELAPFSSETVARAIHASRVPVVSAVGHETDFTIADLVADIRAATPSAGAELAVPSRIELRARVASLAGRIAAALVAGQARRRQAWGRTAGAAALARAPDRVDRWRQRLDDLGRSQGRSVARALEQSASRLRVLTGRLDGLSPLATLGRGYSLCRKLPGGELVRSVAVLGPGDRVRVMVADGEADCRVDEVRSRPEEGEQGG